MKKKLKSDDPLGAATCSRSLAAHLARKLFEEGSEIPRFGGDRGAMRRIAFKGGRLTNGTEQDLGGLCETALVDSLDCLIHDYFSSENAQEHAPSPELRAGNPETVHPSQDSENTGAGDGCCDSSCSDLLDSLGPQFTVRYQPTGKICDHDCPSHSRQQAELRQSESSQLIWMFRDFLDSPGDLRLESQKCRHNPDVPRMSALLSRWQAEGCPSPIEWLHSVRWDVDPEVMYFLGLPFVDGVEFVEYPGWNFTGTGHGFLDSSPNAIGEARADSAIPPPHKTL